MRFMVNVNKLWKTKEMNCINLLFCPLYSLIFIIIIIIIIVIIIIIIIIIFFMDK